MAISYRGKQVDMVSLSKKQEKNVALGNAKMNGRGDILGRGGKIIETSEERTKRIKEGSVYQAKPTSFKKDTDEDIIPTNSESTHNVESEENITRPTPKQTAKKTKKEEDTDKE